MKNLSEWSINLDDFERLSSSEEKIKFLLRFAILAPSTHNSQPWRFLIHEKSCEIFTDPNINIKEADKKGRDLYISMGCLLEHLVIAASYYGVLDRVEYNINSKSNTVATVYFKHLSSKTIDKDSRYLSHIKAILNRATIRGIFKSKKVSEDIVEDIKKLNTFPELQLHLINDSNKIEKLAQLTSEGLRIAYHSYDFRKEMSRWFVNSLSKRRDGLPTYSLNMPFLISLIFPTLVRFVNVGKKVSGLIYNTVNSSPLICIVSSQKDDELTWLKTGQIVERIMLDTTAKGLKNSIFVASVEMGTLYRRVQLLVNTTNIPHFVFCIGYMDATAIHTPRYSLENKIIHKK